MIQTEPRVALSLSKFRYRLAADIHAINGQGLSL